MATPRIALVTGGSRGLGRDMALSLARQGFGVLLTYHSKQDEAQAVVGEIEALGQPAAALQLDTGAVAGFDGFFGQVKQTLRTTFGTAHFDFLINNAGTALRASIADTQEDDFDRLLNIHYKGVFFLTQKALPYLNDGGRVINISSGLARFVGPGYAAYASLKGAVEVFTRYLAQELGPRGITVNTVAPGAIATDFGGGVVRDNEQVNAHLAGVTALGRVGLPTDIGPVVAFLCTPAAGWINAQRIEVSGGQQL